jgi:cell wall-associated NlpC family hydrolase
MILVSAPDAPGATQTSGSAQAHSRGLRIGMQAGFLTAKSGCTKLDGMLDLTRVCLIALTLSGTSAWADALEDFLNQKGLLSPALSLPPPALPKASEVAVHAMGFMGVPYRWGGNEAETGLDCSGFVRAVYQQILGVTLPRTSDRQAAVTQTIDFKDLAPGDLVFFNTMKQTFSHVGIYVGEGRFVHAPRTGERIRLEKLAGSYWRDRFDGARRVVASAEAVPKISRP